MHRRFILLIAWAVAICLVGGVIWVGGSYVGKESTVKRLYNKATALLQSQPDEAGNLLTQLISSYPNSSVTDDAYLVMGDILLAKRMLLEARGYYASLISSFPDSDIIGLAQQRLGEVNIKILFSPIITASDKTYEVKEGDSLDKIAKDFHTTVELLKISNGLSGNTIKPGMRLKAASANYSIVVDKSQNTLSLKSGEEIIKIYGVSTGEHNSTPVGIFKIINKLSDPVWYKAGAIVPPQSPDNILGSRWLGLSKSGYGIHGTTDPMSIGKQVTAGCVRMLNPDVEELFSILPTGVEVTIVD